MEINVLYSNRISRYRDFLYIPLSRCHASCLHPSSQIPAKPLADTCKAQRRYLRRMSNNLSTYTLVNLKIMTAMTKAQLAMAAGVSVKTLQRWLSRHREELKKLGVRPRDKLLPPVAVRYVAEQYGIDL